MNKRITKISYIFIIMFSCFSNSFAQKNNYPNLLNFIDSTNYFFEKEDFKKSYKFSIEALKIAEKLKHDSAIFELKMDQGNIQRTTGLTKKALKAFDSATISAILMNDTSKIVNSLLAKGDCFMSVFLKNRENISLLDSAEKYYHETQPFIFESNYRGLLAEYHEALGHIELYKKNYPTSELLYQKSIKYHLSKNDSTTYLITLINNSNNYIATKQFIKAEEIILKAEKYFKKNNQLSYLLSTYSTMVYLFETKGDYKNAFEYGKLEAATTRKLTNVANTKIITELNEQYNSVKKDKQIAEEKEKSSRTTFYLILSFILLGTLAIIFRLSVHRHRLKQKNLKLLHKEQELLQQSRLEQLESESQHKIINATLDGREEERKAIAETLHNSVSALLSSANLHLQAFKKNISDERHQQILKMQNIIVEASGKIRDLSHNLVSSLLINFGLEYALHDICEKFTSTELEFTVDSNLEQRYPSNTELKIYHIMEELCNNILKHSQASLAEIKLFQTDDQLKISIQDNGIGFNSDILPKKSAGIGLSQIEARVKNMKGQFDIYSKPKEGTLITLTLPLTAIPEEED